MKIHGLQKMTLLDFPGKVACTVFLGGCDFLCPFCHNADILDINAPAVMDDEELIGFLEKRRGLLDGVAFTGGEPLLRTELPELMERIRDMGFKIKLDTNGNHPDRLKSIVGAGLVDYVAMDVKNSVRRYGETIGIPDFDVSRIDESVHFLLEGIVPYEFRTTVIKQFHDEASFREIGQWIRGAADYYLQAFTDRDTVPYSGLDAYSKGEMNRFMKLIKPYVNRVSLRGV